MSNNEPSNDCEFCCNDRIMTSQSLESTHWWSRVTGIIDNQDGSFELFVPQDGGCDIYMDINFCPVCGRKLKPETYRGEYK